nr:MurR/RpiR family transcriptional regulator [uncultured Mediterraneibacter sp.]
MRRGKIMWQDELKIYYSNLSRNQKKVADLFFREKDKAGKMTLKECAEKAGVGQATVLRMLEKSGYGGWAEFQKTIWKEEGSRKYRSQDKRENEMRTENAKIKKYASVYHVIENDLAMIEDMTMCLEMSKLEEVVKIIKKAKLIDVYGTDNSANAAAELSGRLLHLGLASRNYSDLFFQKISAGHLGMRDVAIGFSSSGSTKAVIEALDSAKKAGAVTIAVTAEEESDLAKDADYVFMTPVRHTSEVSRWISSRISQIAFVDALCAAILDSDREKFGKMLTQSASEFEEDIVH